MAESFRGGVDRGGGAGADVRARVAIHGANVEALTGDEVFRIPIARCSLTRSGRKIVVRDGDGALVIWSDDEAFLRALARAQRGTLRDQVERLQGAERQRGLLKWAVLASIAAGAVGLGSVPLARWAVRGGVPSVADGIGESALQRLALPSGVAPTTERELGVLADRLRPTTTPPLRSFRLLLAGYADVHTFSIPPITVIVTSGLVCDADKPDVVMAAVARELAHLERRDVRERLAEAVDFGTTLDLARGDASKLRARMLDFADRKRSPGFTQEQETAAQERANAMLTRAGIALAAGQDLAALAVRAREIAQNEPTAKRPVGEEAAGDWSKVRAEACDLIGR